MPLTFYQSDVSPSATRVRILEDENGIKLDSTALLDRGTKSAESLKLNPLGKLPVLTLGGEALSESEVICEYL
ncbi:MAG: glutathione S-transferase N-terminal domain-containing protein [Rhizomicrobium sp.]